MKIRLLPGAYYPTIRKMYRWAGIFFGLFALYLFAVHVNLFYLFGRMPDYKALDNPESELASEVLSSDDETLGKYYYENRTPVEFKDLSPNLIKALIAVEDVRFMKHSGIDPRSTFRVMKGLFTANIGLGGGSTLSQQLAKNLFSIRHDRRYKGLIDSVRFKPLNMVIIKTKEWITAIELERRYTKEEIMAMYLNTVEFGSNAFGIRSASRTFFSKEPRDLTVEEAAVIAGMLQNPTRFSPKFHPKASKERRNIVYGQMLKYDFLTQTEFDKLKERAIVLKYRVENQNIGTAPYLLAELKKDIDPILDQLNKSRTEDDQYDLYNSGLKIYTSIDSRMQTYAYESTLEHMADQQKKFDLHWKGRNPWVNEDFKEIPGFIEGRMAPRSYRYITWKKILGDDHKAIIAEMKKPVPMRVFSWAGEREIMMSPLDSIRYYMKFLHTGFMAMDPTSGYVKAWVGGINFKHFKFDHVRQGIRQPGSTFKIFVYTTAIDNAYTPCDVVRDVATTLTGSNGRPWTPKNSDGSFSGASMTLRQGLAKSKNSISAQIMKQFGYRTIGDYAERMGITTPISQDPTICLGTSDVSVYDMVNSYSTLVNNGKRWERPEMIVRIEDRFGNTLYTNVPQFRQAIPEATAYLMVHMFRGGVEEPGGTSAGIKRYNCGQGNEIASKTGTTSNYSDGWYMGMTHNLVAGCWVGADERSIHFRDMAYGQGARIAMPLWAKFMDKVYADPNLAAQGYVKGKFKRPESVSYSLDCSHYGGYARDSIATIKMAEKPKEEEGLLQ